MKYLITGSEGFIGTNLTNFLQEKNEEVIGLDLPDKDISLYVIIDSSLDIIVHLAAETNVRYSLSEPIEVFTRNCKSTINMLESARLSKSKFIFASSCGAANPTNPYSASKVAGEAICNAYRESYNMDISILRLSNVYGPHSIHKESVIAKFIKAKLNNETATIYGIGHQMRDFIHVEDVCEAIYTSSEGFKKISTGILTSINSLARMLECKVEHSDPIDGEILWPETKTWKGCKVKLEDGLKSTLNWFKENYKR